MSNQNTEYTATALSRLLDQFDGSVKFRALVSAYIDEVQALEDAAWPLLAERSLALATGDRLDGLGAIVDEARQGRDDTDYRLALIAEFAALSCKGTANEMLEIAQIYIQMPTANYECKEYYPKSIYIRPVDYPFPGDSDATATFLRRLAPAGTQVLFVYAPSGVTGEDQYLFQFSTSPTASETNATQGFANDAKTTGGRLTGAW